MGSEERNAKGERRKAAKKAVLFLRLRVFASFALCVYPSGGWMGAGSVGRKKREERKSHGAQR